MGAWANLFLGLRAMEFTYAYVIYGLHLFVLVVLLGLYFAIEIANCLSPGTVMDLLTKSGGAGIGLNFEKANGELDADDLFDQLSSDSEGIELDSIDAKQPKVEMRVNTMNEQDKKRAKDGKKKKIKRKSSTSDSLNDSETL